MNTVNTSTGFSPFQLKTGRSPRIIPPLLPLPSDVSPAHITAREVIEKVNMDVQQAQDSLTAAKVRQAYHANQHRGDEIVHKEGDLVITCSG
ncbi:hypothetical protein CPC08DRAFT_647956 [Agrocybe pediades]|nr:hypothetical protein CPC08DRAFT_647956 [Agrocybe pediades]